MQCEKFEKELPLFALDELDAERKAAVAAHLAGCPECRAKLADLAAAFARLTEAVGRLPEPVLSAESHRKLAEIAARPPAAPLRMTYFARFAAAALLCVACALLLLPALNRSREEARRRAYSASNLHQYGIGLSSYRGDYAGYLPAASSFGSPRGEIGGQGGGGGGGAVAVAVQRMPSMGDLDPTYADNVKIFGSPSTSDKPQIALNYRDGLGHTAFGFQPVPEGARGTLMDRSRDITSGHNYNGRLGIAKKADQADKGTTNYTQNSAEYSPITRDPGNGQTNARLPGESAGIAGAYGRTPQFKADKRMGNRSVLSDESDEPGWNFEALYPQYLNTPKVFHSPSTEDQPSFVAPDKGTATLGGLARPDARMMHEDLDFITLADQPSGIYEFYMGDKPEKPEVASKQGADRDARRKTWDLFTDADKKAAEDERVQQRMKAIFPGGMYMHKELWEEISARPPVDLPTGQAINTPKELEGEARGQDANGYNVLHGDGHVKYTDTRYASRDPNDNIFIPQTGWGADTDAHKWDGDVADSRLSGKLSDFQTAYNYRGVPMPTTAPAPATTLSAGDINLVPMGLGYLGAAGYDKDIKAFYMTPSAYSTPRDAFAKSPAPATPPTGPIITSSSADGGTTNYTVASVANGTSVNLVVPATDLNGYTFSQWTVNGTAQTSTRGYNYDGRLGAGMITPKGDNNTAAMGDRTALATDESSAPSAPATPPASRPLAVPGDFVQTQKKLSLDVHKKEARDENLSLRQYDVGDLMVILDDKESKAAQPALTGATPGARAETPSPATPYMLTVNSTPPTGLTINSSTGHGGTTPTLTPATPEVLTPPPAAPAPPAEEAPTAPVFKAGPVNPWMMTGPAPLSTFAVDVDTASYSIARNYIARGSLPPPASVRMEEFVNAFDYNYPTHTQGVFTVHAEAGPSPFRPELTLLKIGVRARVAGREAGKPANFVFVVDASGSMERPDRLPLVRLALKGLLDKLDPQDRVSLVAFGTTPSLVLEPTPATEKQRIAAAVDALRCGGTTNLHDGLKLGYETAARQFRPGATNRVILCSDGVANIGETEADGMLRSIAALRRQGITLTVVGCGYGSYDDSLLVRLADHGDGNYVFIANEEEAQRVFTEEMSASLQPVALDAKIQVAFDPARVRRYRLIGFEKRILAAADFRNDAVAGGTVSSGPTPNSGQSSTALYELELLPPPEGQDAAGDLGSVFVRYRNVETGRTEEMSSLLSADLVRKRTAADSPRFVLAACAAQFAELLRGSEHAQNGSFGQVRSVLEHVAAQLPLDARVRELLALVRRAEELSGKR